MKRIIALILVLLTLPLSVSAEECTVIRSCNTKGKKIALTFDDGPHPQRTGEILDILNEYGIKATFFVIGENVILYPELVEREINEGHCIGNHTMNHEFLSGASYNFIKNETEELNELLSAKFGIETDLIRPPGGQYNENLETYCSERGMNIILWSVDTRDWAHTPVEAICENVMTNTKNGAVILFHDFVSGNSPTPEALRIIIPKLKREGYEFVTVDELLY